MLLRHDGLTEKAFFTDQLMDTNENGREKERERLYAFRVKALHSTFIALCYYCYYYCTFLDVVVTVLFLLLLLVNGWIDGKTHTNTHAHTQTARFFGCAFRKRYTVRMFVCLAIG